MDLKKRYATDLKLEEDGIPVDFGDGAEVVVARWGNEAFLRELEAAQRPYRQQLERGTMPREKDRQLINRVIARTIIKSWKGFKEGGEDLPSTVETFQRVLDDPAYKDFRQDIIAAAQSADLFRQEALEAAAKN